MAVRKSGSYILCVMAFFCGALYLSGCQTPTTGNSTGASGVNSDTIQNVNVKSAAPVKNPGITEEFPLPNCGGTGPLEQTLGTQATISKTVEIGGTASVVGGGQMIIPAGAVLKLEMEVEAAYKEVYDQTNSRLDTIGMEAAPKTHVVYTVEWEENVYSSTVSFELSGKLLETAYSFKMNVPKIIASANAACSEIGLTNPPTPIPNIDSNQDISSLSTDNPEGPFRPHYQVVAGDGVFSQGTFSDGMTEFSDDWLSQNRRTVQVIRIEEYPDGCDISRHNTNTLWIAGSTGMKVSINDEIIGVYQIADDPHGYIFEWPVNIGDKICAVNFKQSGFSIILGPNVYYHYDSYCFRGGC